MTGYSSAAQQSGSKEDLVRAAATLAKRDEYGTLILDRAGEIISCGAAAEKIFGASEDRLVGRLVSEFIANLFLGGSSPSYRARYLGFLCASDEWRKFAAKDINGQEFALELNLARMVTDGREIFILNVHRPDQAADSGSEVGRQLVDAVSRCPAT